jgi:hypothetical protein
MWGWVPPWMVFACGGCFPLASVYVPLGCLRVHVGVQLHVAPKHVHHMV